jgi:riboflavin-specific deaminase-like protein
MSQDEEPGKSGGEARPAMLEALLPPGPPRPAADQVEAFGLWERPPLPAGRVRLLVNMVSSVDGRATLGGKSAPISSRADRELFHALRAASDAILVGAGTVTIERYGRTIASPEVRRMRAARGMPEEPLACIVSGRLAVSADVPLMRESEARVVILTASGGELPTSAATVDYIRSGGGGMVDLAAGLAELRERHGVHTVLCEGGPHLTRELIARGLVDELFLSIAPALAGGDPPAGSALRILAGQELEEAAQLELRGVLRSGSGLFLRYGVGMPA